MKLKSFLFLIAALAMGLVFASCGGDTEIEYRDHDVNKGYASDAEAIMAAFKFADDVYLTKETNLTTGPALLIPAPGRLHVNGQTILVGPQTVIIKAGALVWDGESQGKIDAANNGAGAVLVDIDADVTHYGSAGVAGTESFVFVKSDGTITGSTKGYRAALATDTTAMEKVFSAGTYLNAIGGTTAYVIGDFGPANLGISGGTLVVTGNLGSTTGRVATIDTDTPLTVYGNLYGGTVDAASTQDIIKNAGTVTVYKDANIASGKIANQLIIGGNGAFGTVSAGSLAITGNASFTGDAEFSGLLAVTGDASFTGAGSFTVPLAVTGNATFGGDAEFTAGGALGNGAEFSGNVKSDTEQLAVTGEAKFAAGKTLTGYLSANSVTLSGSLSIASGSLATGAAIDVSTNSIILGPEGGIEFTSSSAKLTGGSSTYEVGGAGSLLNSSSDAGTTITFAATGITNSSSDKTLVPSLVFGGDALLVFKSDAVIDGIDFDVKGGSISLEGTSRTLIITGGGSITTGAAAVNIAHGGTIAGSAGAGGSLLVGSLTTGGTIAADNVAAGSVGVSGVVGNFILTGNRFLPTPASIGQGTLGAGLNAGDALDGGSASAGGSILVFTAP
jgi:hypothetical protein